MGTRKSVVLIKAPYLASYGSYNTRDNYVALGVLYIHSFLRKKNIPVYFLDPEAEGLSLQAIIDFIREKEPILVGVSCSTGNYLQTKSLAKSIKDELDDVKIIIGGAHATALPDIILKNDGHLFDYVCIREGEETVYELYNSLLNGAGIQCIKGIAYKSGDKIIINEPRPFIKNLDELPFPSRDQIDLGKYTPQAYLNKGRRGAMLITSRGCPFNCDYCQSRDILGKKIRFHSAEYVLAEIEELYHKYNIKYLYFLDDVFTVNRKRLEKIVEGIRKKDIKIKFWCLAKANMVNDEVLELLKEAGLDSMAIGFESGDEEILREIGKGIRLKEGVSAVSSIKKYKIGLQGYFMLGFYHDTYNSIRKTIDFAVKLDPDFAIFFVMVPFPGTSVYRKYYKDAIDFSDENAWKYFVGSGGNLAGFGSRNFSREELNQFKKRAYRKFYLRPVKVLRLMSKVKNLSQLIEYFKAGFVVIKNAQRAKI